MQLLWKAHTERESSEYGCGLLPRDGKVVHTFTRFVPAGAGMLKK